MMIKFVHPIFHISLEIAVTFMKMSYFIPWGLVCVKVNVPFYKVDS